MTKLFLSAIFLAFGSLASASSAGALPPLEEIEDPTPAAKRETAIIDKTERLLEEQDKDGLEKLAEELRTSRERKDSGVWMLTSFYDTAASLPEDDSKVRKAMEFYEQWAHERPNSITAQVCLAMALINYAWFSDDAGAGKKDLPSEESLERARQVLAGVTSLKETSPEWYEAALDLGYEQDLPRQLFRDLLNEAISREPTYGEYYTAGGLWFSWNGKDGELEDWIAKTADSHPSRDRHYAFLVWMADRMDLDEGLVFSNDRLDWPRTKRGFDLWLEEDPGNLMVRFELTRLALLANDRKTAREQFEITGGKYFYPMWRYSEEFERARQFAFAHGPNPFLSESSSAASSKLPPRTLQAINTFVLFAGRFLGGALAGLALLVLALQRRQIGAGLIAAFVSLLLASFLGTITTLIPAAGLWLYLRRHHPVYPPPLQSPSPWITLLWVIVLGAASLGLQIIAAVFSLFPGLLENSSTHEELEKAFFSDGSAFLIFFNAMWICFLILIAVCLPKNRLDWQNRLGLHLVRPIPATFWAILAVAVIYSVGLLVQPYMDKQTQEASRLMALGLHSPFIFFLAVTIAGPIWEELLFRGYAFSGWFHRLGLAGTACLTSLLFAICHLQYGGIGILYIFFLGLVLALLRWKTGSVYPCMAAHMANNVAFEMLQIYSGNFT